MDMTLDGFVRGTKNDNVGYIRQLQATIIV